MTPQMKEFLAQEYAAQALYASLHTGDPGDTGANELVAVARAPITWNASGVGQVVSEFIQFTIAAEVVVTHVGIWSAAAGGTFLDSVVNGVPLSPGEYSLTLNYTQQ